MASKDDEKYIALMNAYKENRLELGELANKYLEAAQKLKRGGQVSDDAVVGGAYL
jgi:hypothetical protein